LVADFFCGSGTTPLVAAQRGRRFIACDETFRAIHTTRSRLTGCEAPFTLEYDSTVSSLLLPAPRRTTARLLNDVIRLDSDLDIDYWEVDPDWDGITFQSAVQARRPLRNGSIARELKIKAGRKGCVRFVTTQGQQFQLHI
jgi:hypothetical protein